MGIWYRTGLVRVATFYLVAMLVMPNGSLMANQTCAEDQATREILEHISQLVKGTGSYHADVTVTTERKGVSKTTVGQYKYKWPNKSFQEVRDVKDGTLMGFVISNGIIKWNYMPFGNLALKYELEKLDEDAQKKGWSSAASLDETSLEYLGEEQLALEKMYVLGGTHSDLEKHNNPDNPGKVKVFVGIKDGIIRKVITHNRDEHEIGSTTFTNIRIDHSISDQDFEFVPPEGTKIYEVKDVGPRINLEE